MNDEQDHRWHPLPIQRCQFEQMPRSPLGHRVREHSDPVAEECAGFDFQIRLTVTHTNQKIESAVPNGHLRIHDLRTFQPGNSPAFDQMPRDLVGEMRVQKKGNAIPLHCQGSPFGLSCCLPVLVPGWPVLHVERRTRQQEFPKAARIGQVRVYNA